MDTKHHLAHAALMGLLAASCGTELTQDASPPPSVSELALAPASPAPRVEILPGFPINLQLAVREIEGQRTVALLISDLDPIPVRPVPQPLVCQAISKKDGRAYRFSGRWVLGCEQASQPIDIEVSGEQLRIGGQPVLPLPGAKLASLAPEIEGQVPRNCWEQEPQVALDAKLVLRRERVPGSQPERQVWFVVPKLHLELHIYSLSPVEWCVSERVAERLTLSCSTSEASMRFEATAKYGVLGLVSTFSSYDRTEQHLLGSFRLPCGAKLRWSGLRIRDPAWTGVQIGQCGARCAERRIDCEDRCRQHRPRDFREDGRAHSEAGEQCLAACETGFERCRCP